MTKEEFLEMYKDIPEITALSVDMTEANSCIKIYEGEYLLKDGENEIKLIGKIFFDWFPNSRPHFYGKALAGINVLATKITRTAKYKIIVDGLSLGQGDVTNTHFGGLGDDTTIKGSIAGHAILGNKAVEINKVRFSIPNLREFHGLPVKYITENRVSIPANRLVFEDDDFIITIDKCVDYGHRKESLSEKGGYIILYAGELICKKGSVNHSDIQEFFHCFNTFLTFLNGRRTSALFIKGIHDDKHMWCDYSGYYVDKYESVQSWPHQHSILGLNDIWKKFKLMWQDNEDRDFLKSAIHWYVEANGQAGFVEGSLIMAQTALELIFNWWLLEKKGLKFKNSETMRASSKIKLVLSQLNINHDIPIAFSELQSFFDTIKDNAIKDAPDVVSSIRNAIVHSQKAKRKKLRQIPLLTKFQGLQLYLWYIEMSILRILDYDEQYYNRCSTSNAHSYVPWSEKTDIANKD